jgi:exodeoxyribonuclease V alpha subunit
MTDCLDFLNMLRGHGLLTDIDVAFARFIGGHADGDPALTLLAALVSNAASAHGEIALPADRIGDRESLRAYLRNLSSASDADAQESGGPVDLSFVGRLKQWPPEPGAFPLVYRECRPGADAEFRPAPLMLANGLHYLGRALQNELFLRDYLRSRTCAGHSIESIPFETVTDLRLGEEQKAAVAAAVSSKFLVISGGPGTGKTTIVSVILALRPEKASEIILCAPTGKAQMRMKQALDRQLKSLRDETRRAEIANIQSSTIHRLLSWSRTDGAFRHNRKNPLRYKLVIVDECSMIPQSLMVSLLKAVPDDAAVILLGDRHQLSSVEPGSVFGDFCGILRKNAPSCLAELTVSRRFPQGGEICTMKDAINEGQAEAAWNYMTQPGLNSLVSCGIPPKNALRQFLRGRISEKRRAEDAPAWLAGDVPADRERYCDEDAIDDAWSRFERFRILTPFNAGPYGADALNRLVRSILGFPETGSPAPGETFLILQNDYGTNVFNGDTGILWFAGEDGRPVRRSEANKMRNDNDGNHACRLLVFFPDPVSGSKWRGVPPETLPPHAPAYAFTIHKSQGSDYDRILMFLPPSRAPRGNGILTRETVYTGLTRAKDHAVIAASRETFCEAVALHIDRVSGLPGLCAEDKENVTD